MSKERLVAVLRINSGGDANGAFSADAQFVGGSPYSSGAAIGSVGSDVPASVYQSERYGNFEYRLGGLTAGAAYTVRLHFAELYWTDAGRRVFNVDINGSSALANFDIFAVVGANRALVRDFVTTANASGQIVVRYTTVVDNAKSSAIEIFSESSAPPSPPPPTNQPPTVASAATADQNVIAGGTSNLRVLGADDGGEPALVYTWEVLGQPPAPVSFASNGSNSAKNSAATFSVAGTYSLRATIRDAAGLSTTSSVDVVVSNSATAQLSAASYRINCGGDSVSPFAADRYFSGGTPYYADNTNSTAGVPNAAPPAVYQTERYGNFTYTLSDLTPNASYTVRLHFAEISWSEAGKRLFNVTINGASKLSRFDIFATAGGKNKAVVRDFTAPADTSGRIVIQFVTVSDNAKCSAIEVFSDASTPPAPTNQAPTVASSASADQNVPAGSASNLRVLGADDGGEPSLTYTWETVGQPPAPVTFSVNGSNAAKSSAAMFTTAGTYALRVTIRDSAGLSTTSSVNVVVTAASQPSVGTYRVNCGGDAVGNFVADRYFTGGTPYYADNVNSTAGVTNAAPAAVYQTERYGNFSYSFASLTANGAYTVRLHFAEISWSEAGKRVFNVSINGATKLSNFDIFATAGGKNKAVVRDFASTADGSGKLAVQFSTVADNAKCSAIEILSATPSAPPTIASAATANPSTVSGTSSTLSVLGSDDGGEPQLVYSWATTGSVPAPVTFSINDSNAAKSTVARFSKAGTYALTATVRDASGQSVASNVSVVVGQTLTAIHVAPASATVAPSATQQFAVTADDQFGLAMAAPGVSWTVSGGGGIDSSGKFSASSTAGGPFTVTATGSGKSATGSVTISSTGQGVPAPSDTELVVSWSSTRQKIEGFGAADPQFGDFAKDDGAFTDQMADKLFSQTNGIGLTLLRVGINPSGTNWAAWSNATKAAARGARVWATPWSAPAYMKDNGSVTNGGHLLPAYYGAWADMLVNFRNLLKQNSGVDLYALSAQNEPDFTAYYESMLFTNDEMVNFVKVLGPKLAALSPRPKLIVGNYSNWDNLSPLVAAVEHDQQALSFVDFYGSNQYYGTPDAETGTRPVWEMEWSTFSGFDGGIANALEMSRKVHDALTIANVAAWHYWWFRLQADGTDNQALLGPNDANSKRLWALGNWSKFVRPGFVRVATQGGPQGVYVSAFKNPSTGAFAVIVVNDSGSAKTLGISVDGASPTNMAPWRTSSSEDLIQLSSVAVANRRFSATIPAASITTFVGTAN